MADIELVIKIPEETYNATCKGSMLPPDVKNVVCAIKNSILLPKGHGRLIDADKTLAMAWTNFYKHQDEWAKRVKDYLLIGRMYDQNGFECCQQTIVNAPTVIEAESKEERQKAIDEWLEEHCWKCAHNADKGTGFVNCQEECEVQKDVGIACIHYEEYMQWEARCGNDL